MVKVSVFYPNKDGAKFDLDYYLNTHVPLSKKRHGPALKEFIVEQGVNGGPPDSKAPYVVIAHLLFDSAEAFYAAFTPHAKELQGDIVNYTNVEPVIQISEVLTLAK